MPTKPLTTHLIVLLCFLYSCTTNTSQESNSNWCSQKLRAQFSTLDQVNISSDWFKVYDVGNNVYAIAEPYNFQEIISYLIIGTEKALLFDTGMGMGSIASVVKSLTDLPITVLNSHTHYDHIGGNYEFDNILASNLPYTIGRSQNGIDHSRVRHEVTPEAMCLDKLPQFDTASYHIKPFAITAPIEEGSIINLGDRKLEVIAVPGHTPDAIALLDRENGYLWTGDTFYEGPIWLFDPETDLKTYQQSIQKLANLSTELNKVYPAHNTPVAEPIRLMELVETFDQIITGQKKAKYEAGTEHVADAAAHFEFEHFSFFIRQDLLKTIN